MPNIDIIVETSIRSGELFLRDACNCKGLPTEKS